MSPSPFRVRERIRRRVDALRPAARASDALQRAVGRGADALARTDAARALVGQRAADALHGLADVAATRLLALDDDAARLAMIVERIAAGHDTEDVARLMLRRNLVLDGTFLALLEPLLSGGDLASTPEEVIDRGVDTIALLLAELVALDGFADDRPATEQLAEQLDPHDWDVLGPVLTGQAPLDVRTRFVTLSYALFLESWLLRFSARAVGDAVAARAEPAATAIDTESA